MPKLKKTNATFWGIFKHCGDARKYVKQSCCFYYQFSWFPSTKMFRQKLGQNPALRRDMNHVYEEKFLLLLCSLIGKSAESRVCIIGWMTNFPLRNYHAYSAQFPYGLLCVRFGGDLCSVELELSWTLMDLMNCLSLCFMEDIPLLRDLSPSCSDPTKRRLLSLLLYSMMENYLRWAAHVVCWALRAGNLWYFYGGPSGTYRDITKSYIPTGAYHQLPLSLLFMHNPIYTKIQNNFLNALEPTFIVNWTLMSTKSRR